MAKNNFSGSSTQPFVTNVQPVTTSLSNLGFGGINTDDSDDRINSSVMRLMENTDITKNGVIRPRRGYKWVSTLVEDYKGEEFKIIGLRERQESNNGDIYYNIFYTLNNLMFVNEKNIDLDKIINREIVDYAKVEGNWDTFHYQKITGEIKDFSFKNNQYFNYSENMYTFLTSKVNFLLKFDKNDTPTFVLPTVPNRTELNLLGFNSLVHSTMNYDTNFLNCDVKTKLLYYSKQIQRKNNIGSEADTSLLRSEGINDIIISPKSSIDISQNIIGEQEIPIIDTVNMVFDNPQDTKGNSTVTYSKNCINYIRGNEDIYYETATNNPVNIRIFYNTTTKNGVGKVGDNNSDSRGKIEDFPYLYKDEKLNLPSLNIPGKSNLSMGYIDSSKKEVTYDNYYYYAYFDPLDNRLSINTKGYNLNQSSIYKKYIINTFSKTSDVRIFRSPSDFDNLPHSDSSNKFVNGGKNLNNKEQETTIYLNPTYFNGDETIDDYKLFLNSDNTVNFDLEFNNNNPLNIYEKIWKLKDNFPDDFNNNMFELNNRVKAVFEKDIIKDSLKIFLEPHFNIIIRNGQYIEANPNFVSINAWWYTWFVRSISLSIRIEYKIKVSALVNNNSFVFLTAVTTLLNYKPKDSKLLSFKKLDSENDPNGAVRPTITFYYLPWELNKNVWEEPDLWKDTASSDGVPVPDPSKEGNINNWLKPKFPDFEKNWRVISELRLLPSKQKNYTSVLFFTTANHFLIGAKIDWPEAEGTSNKNYTSLFWKQIDLTDLNPLQTGRWITDTEIKSCQKLYERNGQLFTYQGEVNNRIYYSDVNNFGYFPNSQYIDLEKMSPTDKIQNIIPFKNSAIIFTKFSIYIWKGTDASSWSFELLNYATGLVEENAVVSYDNYIYFLGIKGFYALKPGALNLNISGVIQIDNAIKNGISLPLIQQILEGKEKCFSVTTQQQVMFFFPTNKICLKYLPNQQAWSYDSSDLFEGIKKVWFGNGDVNFIAQNKTNILKVDNDLINYINNQLENQVFQNIPYPEKENNTIFHIKDFYVDKIIDIVFKDKILELQFTSNNSLTGIGKVQINPFDTNGDFIELTQQILIDSIENYAPEGEKQWKAINVVKNSLVFDYTVQNQISHYRTASWTDKNFNDDFVDDGREINKITYSVTIQSPYYNFSGALIEKQFLKIAFKFQLPNLISSTRFSQIINKDISNEFYENFQNLKLHTQFYIDDAEIKSTEKINYVIDTDENGVQSLMLKTKKDPYILSPGLVFGATSKFGTDKFGDAIFAEAVGDLNANQGKGLKFIITIYPEDLVYFELVSAGIRYLNLITPFSNSKNITK